MSFVRTLRFYVAPLAPVAVREPPPGLDIRWVSGMHDLPAVLAARGQFQQEYEQRFVKGHTLFLFLVNDECAHWSWIARTSLEIDEIGYRWSMAEHDRCIFDVETLASARGKGLYPQALTDIAAALHTSPVSRIWIYAEAGNSASIRGIEKAGYRFVGSVRALRMGPRRTIRLNRAGKVLA